MRMESGCAGGQGRRSGSAGLFPVWLGLWFLFEHAVHDAIDVGLALHAPAAQCVALPRSHSSSACPCNQAAFFCHPFHHHSLLIIVCLRAVRGLERELTVLRAENEDLQRQQQHLGAQKKQLLKQARMPRADAV